MPPPKDPFKREAWIKHQSKVHKGVPKPPFTEEHKQHIKEARAKQIMPPCSEEKKIKIRKSLLGHPVKEETRLKIKLKNIGNLIGEKHPNWQGGKSFEPYCSKFNNKRKRAVREFFGYLCICTGEPQYEEELSVHHIDSDKEQGCNGKPFNLVPLSRTHHARVIFNQEEYAAYINKTLHEGFKRGIWNEQEYMEKVMY
jgi:hypothetical protein